MQNNSRASIRYAGFAAAASLLAFSNCVRSNNSKSDSSLSETSLSEMPVIASKTFNGTDSIVVADLSSIPQQPYTVKASELVDSLQLVRLENSEDALIAPGFTWVYDKRIIIYNYNVGVKQYDRSTGKYLGQIGAIGHGPGEFISPYDISVDEKAGRIYLIPFKTDKILTYDLNGKHTGDIPLAHIVEKGSVKVDNNAKTVSVMNLLFDKVSDPVPAWIQDLEGNVISEVVKPDVAVAADYSNEIITGINGEGQSTYSLFRMDAAPDTLYSFSESRLRPEFTVKFSGDIPWHSYHSFPRFYIADIKGDGQPVSENSYIISSEYPIIIDRTSLCGGPVKLNLDKWGPLILDAEWVAEQRNPMTFAMTIDPAQLTDMIAGSSSPDLPEESLKPLQELSGSISDDDNCYVLIGPWKK